MPQQTFLISVIFCMMAVTFLIRLIPLQIKSEKMPRCLSAVIEYIPSAVIASITVPGLFFRHDGGMSVLNADTVAAILVVITAYFSRNLLLSVALGTVAQVLAAQFIFN